MTIRDEVLGRGQGLRNKEEKKMSVLSIIAFVISCLSLAASTFTLVAMIVDDWRDRK